MSSTATQYDEVLQRLREAEDIIQALMSAQADAVITSSGVHLLRSQETEQALQRAKVSIEDLLHSRTEELERISRKARASQEAQASTAKQASERQAILADALGSLLSTSDPYSIVRGLFSKVAAHAEMDAYFHYMVDESGSELILDSYAGIAAEVAGRAAHLKFGEGISGSVAQSGRSAVVTNIQNSGDENLRFLRGAGIHACACFPLRNGERLLGTLAFASRRTPHFEEDQLGFLAVISGYTAVALDRARSLRQLRESEEQLRFMAESMPQKIFTATRGGKIDYCNRQWEEYSKQNGAEARTLDWSHLLHPDDVEENQSVWRTAIESCEPIQLTHRFRRGDGEYRWHLTRARAMKSPSGSVSMWIGSSTDIHEQKNTEEDLRTANQALEQFAYAATHDLREPLRGVKIYSELLARECGPQVTGAGTEYLDRVRESATRMELLVQDLLSYTRVGEYSGATESADTEHVLEGVIADLNDAIVQSSATVTWDALPRLAVQSAHLHQLFQNLIDNALKYKCSDCAPSVHISASGINGMAQLAVRDNGIGIAPQYRERIFGLFKRLHTQHQYSGSGIGLAICERIVKLYRGSIWVESEPGQGSVFFLRLPVSQS